jgi:hypothetical protein
MDTCTPPAAIQAKHIKFVWHQIWNSPALRLRSEVWFLGTDLGFASGGWTLTPGSKQIRFNGLHGSHDVGGYCLYGVLDTSYGEHCTDSEFRASGLWSMGTDGPPTPGHYSK